MNNLTRYDDPRFAANEKGMRSLVAKFPIRFTVLYLRSVSRCSTGAKKDITSAIC